MADRQPTAEAMLRFCDKLEGYLGALASGAEGKAERIAESYGAMRAALELLGTEDGETFDPPAFGWNANTLFHVYVALGEAKRNRSTWYREEQGFALLVPIAQSLRAWVASDIREARESAGLDLSRVVSEGPPSHPAQPSRGPVEILEGNAARVYGAWKIISPKFRLVLVALIRSGDRGIFGEMLADETKVGRARQMLSDARKNDADWRDAIVQPGRTYGGPWKIRGEIERPTETNL